MSHHFILQPYKGMATRFRCPECQNQQKTFSRYIDANTGVQLAENVGRCSRENNCSYHYTPKQYFQDQNLSFPKQDKFIPKALPPIELLPLSYVAVSSFQQSLRSYNANNFIQYLISLFGESTTQRLIKTYFVGTSRHWPGASIFWQIDHIGKIRTGKIMLYNDSTGKRVKQPYNHITWVHKQLKQSAYNLSQCLFGLHLLKGNSKPVAIVESEKTAIIASVYLPRFIWLATGSLCNLTNDKCKHLKGRKVTLFPDLNGYDKWLIKSSELSQISKFVVSDLLEKNATLDEKQLGLDLADYLIRFSVNDFRI